MKEKIKAEINSGVCPVWLSPNIGGTPLTMFQNFSISLERITAFDEQPTRTAGPGEVSCVILRGFSKITSKNAFESAELAHSSDKNWNFKWLEDNDLEFTYSDETPFKKSGDKYEFTWRNFYTDVSPDKKEISLSVEAYSIPSCEDGEQGILSVKLACPAYIMSFQPDEEKSKGIVRNDTAERKCIVSRDGTVELCWYGAADFTDVTELKKDGVPISGSFMINGSYSVKKVSENSRYELVVTNSYRFPHHLTYDICKTDWQKKTEEKGIFQTNIYGDLNFNSQIFYYNGSLYAYLHPFLYKKDAKGEWKSLTENKLYGDGCSCHAAHLHEGTLYAAVIKNSGRFSICRYDMKKDEWQTDMGSVRLPYTEKGIPICCGFAVLKHDEYFYCVEKDFVSVYKYNKDFAGWNSGSFYVNAPENTELIGGGMICRGNRFYIAMLCTENGDAEKKNVYLYDCSEHNEEWLMKSRVSKDTSRIIMLKTVNNLWIATDREIINCDKITRDGLFYPVCADNQIAWFGSDEDNVFGIFPDKNLWVYNTFDDSSALSRINGNYKSSEKEKSI